MSHLVPVKEFTDAAAIAADAARRRALFYPPPPPLAPARPAPVPAPVRIAEPPKAPRPKADPRRVGRNLMWTADEDNFVIAQRRAGCRAEAIAAILKRSVKSIRWRACLLGAVKTVATPPDEGELSEAYRAVSETRAFSARRAREIIHFVAAQSSVEVSELLSECRTAVLAQVRQQAMWLIAKETDLSYPVIGRMFGRDHTTVIHAVRRCNAGSGENVRRAGTNFRCPTPKSAAKGDAL